MDTAHYRKLLCGRNNSRRTYKIDNDINKSYNGTKVPFSSLVLNSPPASWKPRIMVLVVHEGSHDHVTGSVFQDIAAVTTFALKRLGCDVVVKHCIDLRFCTLSDRTRFGRFFIILGVHHLARYTIGHGVDGERYYRESPGNDEGNSSPGESGRQQITIESAILRAGFPDPSTTVLYNFEHASGQEDLAASPVLASILQRWSDATQGLLLWDYSEGNVLELARRGIHATHVPLGYAPFLHEGLRKENKNNDVNQDDSFIDVLFYGMLNKYRRRKLQALREQYGIKILHANANGPAFGTSLLALLRRTKIVLNLRYFDGEVRVWKY